MPPTWPGVASCCCRAAAASCGWRRQADAHAAPQPPSVLARHACAASGPEPNTRFACTPCRSCDLRPHLASTRHPRLSTHLDGLGQALLIRHLNNVACRRLPDSHLCLLLHRRGRLLLGRRGRGGGAHVCRHLWLFGARALGLAHHLADQLLGPGRPGSRVGLAGGAAAGAAGLGPLLGGAGRRCRDQSHRQEEGQQEALGSGGEGRPLRDRLVSVRKRSQAPPPPPSRSAWAAELTWRPMAAESDKPDKLQYTERPSPALFAPPRAVGCRPED